MATQDAIDPLSTVVVDESSRYGVAVVDRFQTWLYVYSMGELDVTERIRHEVRIRHNERAGTSVDEQPARHHDHDTSERLTLMVRRGSVDLLVVAGRSEVVAALLPCLPPDVRQKVVGTFAIDPDHMTARQVRQEAERVVEEYERRRRTDPLPVRQPD